MKSPFALTASTAVLACSLAACSSDDGGSGSIYRPLLLEVAKFFQTGVAPVSAEETLELLAFMEAADASKKDAGRPAPLAAK